MPDEIALYDPAASPCARRVRIALLEWTARVSDGEVVSEAEAARLSALLHGRLKTLDERLAGREFLVGDAFSIADVPVLPRVAMYPWIGLAVDGAQYPHVVRWIDALGARPSFARSIGPDVAS